MARQSREAAKRNFLRRTKATSPPETTDATPTDNNNTETTTIRLLTRRGNSKYKTRKELEKDVERNEIETISRRPALYGGARRSERPAVTRKFVSRRRPGGANATTSLPTTTPVGQPTSSTTRRPFRIASRRRPPSSTTIAATTTTTSTQATTSSFEYEESLQEIGDTDAIEDPTLEPKAPKTSFKTQRRPLIVLKEVVSDQNPSATNEEENKRQSKKFSASIKQNQLDDLLKNNQEESSTERKTTADDFNPETAVAIVAHQLITAPVPIITDFEDEYIKPTKRTHTTLEYKYTNKEYNDGRTPTYEDFQSTPVYKINNLGSDATTAYNTQSTRDSTFDSTKTSDFDTPKSAIKYTTTTSYKNDFDSSKISTYEVPKPTIFPNTANTNQDYIRTTSNDYSVSEYDTPKTSLSDLGTNSPVSTVTDSGYIRTTVNSLYTNGRENIVSKNAYLPKSTTTVYPTNTISQGYIRTSFPEASTEFVNRNSATFPSSSFPNTVNQYIRTTATSSFDTTEDNLPKGTLTPRTATTFIPNSGGIPSGFRLRSTAATELRKGIGSDVSANVVTSGYSGVQRGTSRYRTEKLIPVPVENGVYSTASYSSASQEPSYFTREYLLESPVTKTYDDEYQYLSPITTSQTPPTPSITRKIIIKKIQRRISTTQRPTTAPTPPSTTTVKSRRVPVKPFEKVSKEPKKTYRPIANYDYYDESDEKIAVKYVEGTKVILHENGNIQCLDIGNFPHPISCKKFISCARIDNGSLLGWEYICPKGLSFDPVGGICNWSAGLGCDEKDT